MAASRIFCKILCITSVFSILTGLLSAQVNSQFQDGNPVERQGSSVFLYQNPKYPRDCSEVRDFCSSSASSGVYFIKPDGYEEPFEAYCDNDSDSGGWTTILRRLDGYVDFRRRWNEYKIGFGFLWTEFWLGNDKLSYLTNQAVYELRIDITFDNGTSCDVRYDAFRISDERSGYTFSEVGVYESNTTCKWKEGNKFTPMDESIPRDDSSNFTDCDDVFNAGYIEDGIYFIRPAQWTGPPFEVFCNMSIDFGSWIVFQRQVNGSTDFYRNWEEYKHGFGDLKHGFWLGNDKLHHITQQGMYEGRIDFVRDSVSSHEKYNQFRIDNEVNKYRVTILEGAGGSLGDTLNLAFSTYDQDNDGQIYNCAEGHHSGWWHGGTFGTFGGDNCFTFRHRDLYVRCSFANLNGDYNASGDGKKIFHPSGSCSSNTQYTEMKIRRIFGT